MEIMCSENPVLLNLGKNFPVDMQSEDEVVVIKQLML